MNPLSLCICIQYVYMYALGYILYIVRHRDQTVGDAGIDQNPVPNEVRNTVVVRLIVQKFLVTQLVSVLAKVGDPCKECSWKFRFNFP